jgi:pyrroloquinoline quinone (PQQ) biosynthesis protein C
MSFVEGIRAAFRETMAQFEKTEVIQLLLSGQLSVGHYKSILCQVYHYTKENPQLQALAAVAFRGDDRELVRQFLGHAISEIGHDKLALNDFCYLGGDASGIPRQYPLPATTALTSFGFYCIQQRAPIGYLGYLYFLEFMPTSNGNNYANLLRLAGIPSEAMTFLRDHTTIDIAHNRLMERYLVALVRTQSDASAIIYAIRCTGYLYSQMLVAAIKQLGFNENYGDDALECARMDAP